MKLAVEKVKAVFSSIPSGPEAELPGLVISSSYGRVIPPPSAVLLRSFGASEPGGPPSHNNLKSRRPSSSHSKKSALPFNLTIICILEMYSLTG
jgi:hypothetical protein